MARTGHPFLNCVVYGQEKPTQNHTANAFQGSLFGVACDVAHAILA
jgi:hypothetical protein